MSVTPAQADSVDMFLLLTGKSVANFIKQEIGKVVENGGGKVTRVAVDAWVDKATYDAMVKMSPTSVTDFAGTDGFYLELGDLVFFVHQDGEQPA